MERAQPLQIVALLRQMHMTAYYVHNIVSLQNSLDHLIGDASVQSITTFIPIDKYYLFALPVYFPARIAKVLSKNVEIVPGPLR
ncbi:hypothetical protein D3C75_1035650 [compost metagenome]